MNHATLKSAHGTCLLVLAAVVAVMIFLYGHIDVTNEAFKEWDSHRYLAMASAAPHLDPGIPRPFAYRLLGPYLVGLLPGPGERAFLAVDLALSVLFVYLMYRFLQRFGLRPAFACLATVLYVFNKHFFGFTSWNYFHVNDVLANVLFIVMFVSLFESRWLVFASALCLGVATRETALFMIPVGLLYLVERRTLGRDGGTFLAAIAPGVAVFAALRLLIHPSGGDTMLQALSTNWTKMTSLERMYHVLINPFVPLTLVPLIFLGRTRAFFRGRLALLLFFALAAGTTLFGANNERLLNPASLVFYPLIGLILQDCIWPNRLMIALVLAAGFLSSFHWLVARYPLPDRNATIVLSGGSLVAVTVALVIFRILEMRGGRAVRGAGAG
ncbi:MAG: hypothetical protein ABR899_10355 [Candidatus Krumholzibacteriaceae bacterium]